MRIVGMLGLEGRARLVTDLPGLAYTYLLCNTLYVVRCTTDPFQIAFEESQINDGEVV